MRYESALKVIRFLKQHIGEAVSIRGICRGIDLSYQPTYAHVRSLEREGVIRTARVGREVACELAPAAATTLWLGLASIAERREFLASSGAPGRIVRSVAAWLDGRDDPAPLAVALRASSKPRPSWDIIAIVPDGAPKDLAGMGEAGAEVAVTVWSESDFREVMGRVFERSLLLAETTVLHGEQRFWRLAFSHQTGDAHEEAPAAEPPARTPRKSRRAKRARPHADRRKARRRRSEDDALFID